MEVKKSYKQTDVGMIPKDWHLECIGSTNNVTSGGTPSTTIPRFWNGEIHWMNSGELNLKIVTEVSNRITADGLRNSATKLIPKHCVLIGLAGQGKTRGTAAFNLIELCTNQSIASIHPSSKYDQKYLYYNIDSRYDELRSLSTGDGGRGGLNLSIIKKFKIPVPSIIEQTAIASALSDADAYINSLEKLIEKKRLIKQGALQDLLTGRKRLQEFENKSKLKETDIGLIPEDWNVFTLSSIGNTIIGLTYSPNNVKKYGTLVLRSSNVQNMKLSFNDNVYVDMDLPERVIVKENDLLICVRNGSRQLIGKCALIDKKTSGSAFGAFMSIYRSKHNSFVYYQFQSQLIQWQINETLGATINQLTNKDLSRFKVAIPSDTEEEKSIVCVLKDLDNNIYNLENKLWKAKSIKQGMMQNLLTGKIRLI